ncbi:MAG TPA: nuclear transport factor 2 family protein [Sphingomicrobium sp.]
MGAKLFCTCALAASLIGCMPGPSVEKSNQDSKVAIEQLFDRWDKAFEAKDLNGSMAMYIPGSDLTAYDIVPPLQYKGADAYRKDYVALFDQFDGPIHIEDRDQHIEVQGDLAFAYGLERMTGKLKNGTPVDMWMRYTEALRFIGNEWKVVHEHVSVPVDLKSGKALTHLKP